MARVHLFSGAVLTDDRTAHLVGSRNKCDQSTFASPRTCLAHLVLGGVYTLTSRAVQGIAEFEQALLLDRNSADAHAYTGYREGCFGSRSRNRSPCTRGFTSFPSRYSGLPVDANCGRRPRYSSARMPKPSLGYDEALRPTTIILSPILRSPLPWACSARWMKREPLQRRDLRSIQVVPSAACDPS